MTIGVVNKDFDKKNPFPSKIFDEASHAVVDLQENWWRFDFL